MILICVTAPATTLATAEAPLPPPVMVTVGGDVYPLPACATTIARTVALVLSSVAFAFYHPLRDASGTFSATRLAFYMLAGVYFGVIYLWRGFGIVVAVHAFYDILTVLVTIDASE